MKNLVSILLPFIFVSTAWSQRIIVTPLGLRDSSDVNNNYCIIEVKGKASLQLFNNAVSYVELNYKKPKKAIKTRVEGELLIVETRFSKFIDYGFGKIPIRARYSTELRFKDGKVRYEIVSLEMRSSNSTELLFQGSQFENLIIYKKNGELFDAGAKAEIERYFDSKIKLLALALGGDKTKGKNDW
jgi:hypothetical protein